MEEILKQLLIDTIKGRLRHPNYERTVELARLYSKIISGKDIDTLLKQFVRREDAVMFEQRVNLTQQITPSISNGLIKTFNKVFRTTPATESIDYDPANEKGVKEVKESLNTIFGKKDVYKYMQDRFTYYTFVDPNAFIYTTFDSFNAEKEKPKPYNIEITSEAAINYLYFNNELKWLITKVDHDFMEDNKTIKGSIYTIYGKNYAFVFTQVGKDYIATNGEEIQSIEIKENEVEFYIVELYNHKSEEIPVIQVGYERDLETQGETFVSPIHPAVPYFMKLIKTVSEFDLTNCLHAFPKLFQYIDSCSFDKTNSKCLTSGKVQEHCSLCNKTGFKLHTSAQDAVILKMPKAPEDMMDLSKMIHVETPSIELLEFQNKLINEYVEKVNKAVFNSETFTKSEVAQTATGENIDMQNVYDTLKPFAEKVSDVWMHIATVSSYYLDYKKPLVAHSYPNDFKLKTSAELLGELSTATQSNAGGYIVAAIESDIMREKYIDAPLEFQKYESKQKFFPFKGKSKEEIQSIITSGIVREDDIILYNYFETIFSELEDEYITRGVWFYDLTPELQRAAIEAKIQEIRSDIDMDKAIEFPVS